MIEFLKAIGVKNIYASSPGELEFEEKVIRNDSNDMILEFENGFLKISNSEWGYIERVNPVEKDEEKITEKDVGYYNDYFKWEGDN